MAWAGTAGRAGRSWLACWVAFLVCLVCLSPRLGWTEGVPVGSLTTEAAVALALSQNPDLRAFRKRRDVAEGLVVSSRALANPTLKIDVLHLQETNPDRVGFGVGLEWAPPQPWEYRAKRAEAVALRDSVQKEIAEQELELSYTVRGVFALCIELENQVKALDSALGLRRRIVETLRKKLQTGGSTRIEVNLAELALLRLRRRLDDITVRQVQAEAQLKALLGVVSAAPLALRGSPLELTGDLVVDPQALSERALADRPGLLAAQSRITSRKEALKMEESRRLPWLKVAGRYRHNDASGYPRDGQISLDLTVPIFDQNRGPIARARAEESLARAEAEAQIAALRQRIYAACAEVKIRAQIIRRHQTEAVPLHEEHERLLQTAIKGAEIDLLALLEAEDAILRDKLEYGEARIAFRRAFSNLEGALGRPIAGGPR